VHSPIYGIRSYSYILLHALVGKVVQIFAGESKIAVFYGIRAFLGLFCAVSESVFYCGVLKKFGPNIAKLCLLILASCTGLFISSTAYLPSSFSMYGVMLAFGCWFGERYSWAITMAAFSCIGGWPFTVIVYAPLALHIAYQRGILKVIWWSVLSLVYFMVPSVLVDFYFYHKWMVCVLNIFLYNATANTSSGSQLFGVEPWTYYVKNLFLNFNLVFIFAVPALLIAIVLRQEDAGLRKLTRMQIFTYLVAPYLWMAFMFYLPHKEERFLFVIYPLICLCASISIMVLVHFVLAVIGALMRPSESSLTFIKRFLLSVILIVFISLSVSRAVSLTHNYGNASQLYTHMSTNELQEVSADSVKNICVGKEWYRFPSNFFLPSEQFQLRFIKSGFGGQLPQPFAAVNGTSRIPTGFNNLNQEEVDRYVDVSECDYMIDLDLPYQNEDHYCLDSDTWQTLALYPFLDVERSTSAFFRAFYFPGRSDLHNAYGQYCLLRRR